MSTAYDSRNGLIASLAELLSKDASLCCKLMDTKGAKLSRLIFEGLLRLWGFREKREKCETLSKVKYYFWKRLLALVASKGKGNKWNKKRFLFSSFACF
jgi:hypothetical protein